MSVQSILPSNYWNDWISKAEKRWPDYSTRIMQLQRGGLYPNVYPEIVVAFTAPASPGENTTDARSGLGSEVSFHEIGLFQIPAGPAGRDENGIPQLPAPNPDPDASNNTWGRLHDDSQVHAALGRSAVMGKNEWKTHLDDQFAVGLAMLRDCYRVVSAKLPDNLRPSAMHTTWGVWLTFMAFSAGAGGAADVVRPFGGDLARVEEKFRPDAHVHFAARAITDGGWHRSGKQGRHSNPAHRILRTWQKFAFAAELAKRVNDSKAFDFFNLEFDSQRAAHEEVIAREDQLLSPSATRIVPIQFPPMPL